MVNESTGGTKHAERISLTAHEKRHFVANMCQMTGLGNTSLNKYAKIAGVPTARLGDLNFCWTDAEAIKILTAILEGSSEVGVRAAIPGDAKSTGNIGLRRIDFRVTYTLPASRASGARMAIGPCFPGSS